MVNATSIFSRKRDLVYLAFFIIHVPVLFCKSPVSSRSQTSPNQNPINHPIKSEVTSH